MKRLVILSPNWLGDAVMALPAIADVRRAAPDASITIAARPAIAPLFRARARGRRDDRALARPAAIRDVVALARAGRRARRRRFRHGAAAAELDARRPARVARRHSRTLGISDRLARPAADARDRAAGRAAPGRVVSAARPRARFCRTVRTSRASACRRRRATARREPADGDGLGRSDAAGRAGAGRGVRRREALAAGVFRRARRGARGRRCRHA